MSKMSKIRSIIATDLAYADNGVDCSHKYNFTEAMLRYYHSSRSEYRFRSTMEYGLGNCNLIQELTRQQKIKSICEKVVSRFSVDETDMLLACEKAIDVLTSIFRELGDIFTVLDSVEKIALERLTFEELDEE